MSNRVMLAVVLGVLLSAVGCSRRGAEKIEITKPEKKTVTPAQQDMPLLPWWASGEPSPELVRAAKVLRPVPFEEDDVSNAPLPENELKVLKEMKRRFDPLLWELFGTLTDEQMERFKSAKRISLNVSKLAPEQRKAFEKLLDSNQEEDIRLRGMSADLRVALYKFGAKEDLSNVEIAFYVEGADMVGFAARVPDQGDVFSWVGWAKYE